MVTVLNQRLKVKRYIARFAVKNKPQKYICHGEIGLRAQNVDILLLSIANGSGRGRGRGRLII